MPENTQKTTFKLAVWGPPASGKTSLLQAWPKALSQFPSSELILTLSEVPANGDPEEVICEENLLAKKELYCLRFTRKLNGWNSLAGKDEEKARINNISHVLNIFNPPGSKVFPNTHQYNHKYLDAELVILILDATQLEGSPSSWKMRSRNASHVNDLEPNPDEEIDLSKYVRQSMFFRNRTQAAIEALPIQPVKEITKQAYTENVRCFLEIMKNHKGRLAVCLTKIDRLPVDIKTIKPAEMVEKLFGREMMDVIKQYDQKKIRYYAVSAFGNMGKADESMFDQPQLWHPVNVEKPLLDELQNKEKLKFMQGNGILSFLFSADNLKKYVSYYRER